MTVDQAQAEIGRAFVNGGPGAIVSSLVWFVAAAILVTQGIPTAFAALFFGGMLIFPLSTLVCKLGFGRSGSVKGNPLGLLALESTIAMIGCLIAAWLLLRDRPDQVFPIAAIAVGTHYFAFKTAYGDRTFWLLGALITLAGCAGLFWLPGRNLEVMLAVGAIELVLGLVLTRQGMAAGRG